MKKEQIHFIIPAFNEEKKIGTVVENLKDSGYKNILVVDDGSNDKTYEICRTCNVKTLRHIINRGQGAALRTGIEYLREYSNPEVIVTFDSDGQHKVEDIPDLVTPILNKKADITLGSRFLNKKTRMPLPKKIILKLGIVFTNLTSNIKLTDTHNGLRALGKKAIHSIEISQRGMEHASEIIDEIKAKNLKYKEVPVEIIYSEYSIEKGQKITNFLKIGIKVLIKKLS
jgi:glycosyltransferase involved in cell wall biosynthesis